MSHSIFKKLNVKESNAVIKTVNETTSLSDFDSKTAIVMGQNLSFYPEYSLMEISDKSVMPEKQIFALYKSPKDFKILDFTNKPIYELNESCPINLDTGTVIDYVRFFFNFVRGNQGRFIISESLEDITWQDEPPLNARKAIAKLLTPLNVISHKNKIFILRASYLFLDSLIQSDVIIDDKGGISIDNEEILIEDMPVIHEDFD